MNSDISFIATSHSISVIIDGNPYTIEKENVNFEEVKRLLNEGDICKLKAVLDKSAAIKNFMSGNVEMKAGVTYYKGKTVNNYVVIKIIDFIQQGLPYKPLVKFLDKLMDNPSYRAVQELYGFLEYGKLPITPDGDFIAYRKVSKDWKDFYTEKNDNSIGKVIEMPRNQVNENSEETCSFGLHFCSKDYLREYRGNEGRVVLVKINPANVVAIPKDYHNTKGRCCKYEVVAECTNFEHGEVFGEVYEPKCGTGFGSIPSANPFCEEEDCDMEQHGEEDCRREYNF